MNSPDLFVLAPIVLLAFLVETTAGFGATVIAVTLASHFVPLDVLLAVFLPLNLVLSAGIAWNQRAHIDWEILRRHVAAVMLPSMAVGMALFELRERLVIRAVFATFVILLSLRELHRIRVGASLDGSPLPWGRRIAALVGAGLVHGIFASGGPLLVYVVGRELPDKARFRATLSTVWLGLNLIIQTRLLLAGSLNATSLRTSALLLVPLAAGIVLGDRLHRAVDARRFRIGVFSLLLFAGGALLARSL